MKNFRLIVHLFFLLMLSASCHSIAADVKSLEAAGLRSDIRIIEDSGCVYAIVVHKNIGESDLYLPPDFPVFHLIGPDKKWVPYEGPFVDAPVLAVESFARLQPRDSQKYEILLNRHYDIRRQGNYRLEFNIDYFDPLTEKIIPRGVLKTKFKSNGQCRKSL